MEVQSGSVHTISFDSNSSSINGESFSNRTGSLEGRRIVTMRANACKVATVFTLILIGSSKLGSLCFDDQDPDISGLTSRTYEAVNAALLIGLLTLQYTRPGEKLKNVFETGKICSYEFFAALIAAHTLSYSFFFLTSSATKDPLSGGIYGASLATVLVSYANVYKEHRAACEIDPQDEYHSIEDLPPIREVNSNIRILAKASIPVLWGMSSASFASLSFSDQNGLTPRPYEIINVGLVIGLLTLQQTRSNKLLKNPLEVESLCSYEFLSTVQAANMVAYSLLFLANASKLDPLSAAIYGGTLSATLSSYLAVFKEHFSASKDQDLSPRIESFFNYDNNNRVSVAVDDELDTIPD
jgi:hypothetical protein